MAEFYSDIELETLIDNVAEAITSRDVREWPKWVTILIERINKSNVFERGWIWQLIKALEKAHEIS